MLRIAQGFLLLVVPGALTASRCCAQVQTAGADEASYFLYRVVPDVSSAAGAVGTVGTPSAYARTAGRLAIGALLQSKTRSASASDGAISLTFGFGTGYRWSADATLNLLSVGVHEPIGSRVSLGARMSLRLNSATSVALGVRNGLIGGGSDAPSQIFLVMSTALPRPDSSDGVPRIGITVGLGYLYAMSGHRPYQAVAQEVASRYGPTVLLASVRIAVTPSVSGFIEWTGEDMNVGLVVPIGRSGLALAPMAADLTRRAPGGPRFVLGFGLPVSL